MDYSKPQSKLIHYIAMRAKKILCVKAIVINPQGEILTIRRTKTAPTHPLEWDFPGGIVDAGEKPHESMIRELHEEIGMKTHDITLLGILKRKDAGADVTTIFYRVNTAPRTITLSYEHDRFQWVLPHIFLTLPANKKLKQGVEQFLK